MKTVTFHQFDIATDVKIEVPEDADVLGIVMRGDTPALVVCGDHSSEQTETVQLNVVGPGGEAPVGQPFIGAFFARGFYAVFEVI